MLSYPVNLIHDPETHSVMAEFPDVPFAHSAGDNEEEALLNAADALESALEIYLEENRPVPVPSGAAPGRSMVRLPVLVAAKVLLWNEMQCQGVGKAELARRVGCRMPEIERLLDLRHGSKIEQVEAALIRLGKHLEIGLAA